MRITDHVYVLSGSYYSAGGQSNLLGEVYGVDAPGGLILIDSGFSNDAVTQIKETLASYGLPLTPAYVILTHAHFDHSGNAKAFQDMGAKIVVGAEDAYQCLNGGSAGLDLPTPFDDTHIFPAFTPDVTIDGDGEKELCGLTVRFIKTAGHTPGSIAPLIEIDGKKILFTGDALQPQGGALLDSVTLGWQGDVRFSRESILNSMMHLLETAPDADIVLPGHGKVCLKNGGAIIRLAAQTAFVTMR
jgi:glyoxylase-like metal-dependent hydrolase (beta-lactamase superfamily II)